MTITDVDLLKLCCQKHVLNDDALQQFGLVPEAARVLVDYINALKDGLFIIQHKELCHERGYTGCSCSDVARNSLDITFTYED